MASSGGRSGRSSQQREAEDYLSRIKLREIFQVRVFTCRCKNIGLPTCNIHILLYVCS